MTLNSNDIVLFSGDSITDGNRGHSMDCNHIMGHGFQYIIASKLALENAEAMPKFFNKGYSGARMADLFGKWQADVIENKPTVLSILDGTNDGLFGFINKISAEEAAQQFKDNLIKALEVTREKFPQIKIIICEPFYFPIYDKSTGFDFVPHPYCEENHGRPDRDETRECIEYRLKATKLIAEYAKEIAEKYADAFVPIYDDMAREIAKSRTEYFMWDGTHPTITGHEVIARAWLNATENL